MSSFVPPGSHVLHLQSGDTYWPFFYPQASQGISASRTRKVIWLIPSWRISRAQSNLGRKTHTSISHTLPLLEGGTQRGGRVAQTWDHQHSLDHSAGARASGLAHETLVSYTWSQSVIAGRSEEIIPTAIILKDGKSCDQPLLSWGHLFPLTVNPKRTCYVDKFRAKSDEKKNVAPYF